MVNYSNLLNAVKKFIDYDMIGKASGNQKIILRIISTVIGLNTNILWEKLKDNKIIKMFNLMEDDKIDLDNLESILVSGLGDSEFEFRFKLLGTDYKFYLNAEDVHKIKSYSGGM